LRAVILAFFEALTFTGAPVAGFRAMRAARSTRANLANPEIATGSPLALTDVITSVMALMALSTIFGSRSPCAAVA